MAVYKESNRQSKPDINRYVYNALSDLAYEIQYNEQYDVNREDMQKALDNFMRKFFD